MRCLIPGFEAYAASEDGHIYRVSTGHRLKPEVIYSGYLRVNLGMGRRGHYKRMSVHRAVASAFHPNPHQLPLVHHIDGNRANNCASNLVWATHAQNSQAISKLTASDVLEIRKLLAGKHLSQATIGELFGVSRQVVQQILLGNSWKSVK